MSETGPSLIAVFSLVYVFGVVVVSVFAMKVAEEDPSDINGRTVLALIFFWPISAVLFLTYGFIVCLIEFCQFFKFLFAGLIPDKENATGHKDLESNVVEFKSSSAETGGH